MSGLPARGAPMQVSPTTMPDRSANGQTFQIELRHTPGHEVRDDPRGAACHGPTHVAVAAVQEEIAVLGEAENRRPIRRHRPETRPVLATVAAGRAGKEVAREADDVLEIARSR